jgi:hypothetical protein
MKQTVSQGWEKGCAALPYLSSVVLVLTATNTVWESTVYGIGWSVFAVGTVWSVLEMLQPTKWR